MTGTDELHVVVEASGGTGGAISRQPVAQGRHGRAVNRSGRADLPPQVELDAGDATDPVRMREVCRGATVVYNCVNPHLRGGVLHAARGARGTPARN